MHKIAVKLENHYYDIFIGEKLSESIVKFHKKKFTNCNAYIITDKNVKKIYLDELNSSFIKEQIFPKIFFIKPGENSKSFKELEILAEKVISQGVNRNDVIYSLGGGVVGDLVGFLSSILLRGIKFIQIPTTLLSQVDSSIGGKTAINTKYGKNLIGSFYQPEAVFIDILTLNSLPKKEFQAGYAEVVKYSLINDKSFFIWLDKHVKKIFKLEKKIIIKMIINCCKKKAAIVKEDEKENNMRIFLNLGHTFAHAIEAELNYTIRHGEAVSIGLLMAMKLSCFLKISSEYDFNLLLNHLEKSLLPTSLTQISAKKKWLANDLIKKMSKDKKVYKGEIRFVLCEGIGKVKIEKNIENKLLKKVIESFY
tara:strand:+ start:122 stop:1219 length:1098 start_codon:yes stop_codon:yes gene_type:complete